jgi:glycosyltransferase involved in cell wall biosynthesis
VIGVSDALAHELVTQHRVPGSRVEVVEPGRDLAGAPAAAGADTSEHDMRRGRSVALLCVANWTPNKGVLELLEAVAALPVDAATLHLVGRVDVDSRYSQRVRARLAAPDVSSRVVVHGPLEPERLGPLYAGADAFVLPSRVETYGTVYAEALAAGLPVVGWRSGNLPNLVEHGREGILVTVGDVAGLSGALATVAGDAARRAEMRAAARCRATTLPTWHESAARFFAALRPLAS